MLPSLVADRVGEYLSRVDDALPGLVEGFYVVGSTALGAFRPARSDIDFLAVTSGDLDGDQLSRLRAVHRRLHRLGLARALPRLQWPLVCNGCYVRWDDLPRAATDVVPLASHVAGDFEAGAGFDVNPVTWRTLATGGIAVRGPDVDTLTIHDDDALLRRWTLDNLNRYWKRWAEDVRRPGIGALKASVRHLATAWGALGAPRLHHTIATGAVISKEQAGEYALDVFDARWHPLVRDALAYWRGEGSAFRPAGRSRQDTADFVAMVVESGNALELRT